MKKQAGFTIIELVVVIALLGILSAVALPRFIDVTDDANAAAVRGTAGALQAGVALVKAQAVVEGANTGNTVDVDDVNIVVNAERFPVRTSANVITGPVANFDANPTAGDCEAIWGAVLQTGAPTVGANEDYTITVLDNDCLYTFATQVNGNNPTIEYDPTDGSVTVNIPE